MTSQDTAWVGLPEGRAAAWPVGGDRPGHGGGGRRRLGAMHEGGVLLDDGWGYCGEVGPSCSTHNPWSVDPDPRGVDRLGPTRGRSGAEPARCGQNRRRTMASGPSRGRQIELDV